MNDLWHIIPEIFLLLASLCLLPAINMRKSIPMLIVILITLIITYTQKYYNAQLIFHDLIAISPFIQYLKMIILSLVAVTLLMMSSVDKSTYSKELPILIGLSTIGMLSLVASHDLLSMYMAIELQSLPMYIMAAINRQSLQSSESGVKYFVLGALASGILLYGISMVYGFAGSTNFMDLTQIFRDGDLKLGVLVGMILIICAFAFKIAAVPFHMWIPDVYQGSPTIVTTFFAVVPKIALIGFMIRIFDYELVNIKLQQVFILLAMLSMVVSALGALKQTNIKRLLAYSSIGHMGYILIGIAATIENKFGSNAITTYAVLYGIMNIGMFAFILRLANYDLKDLAGLSTRYPLLSLSLVIILLSMAGIPPTAGFFAKLYILKYAIGCNLWWLALFALLVSVISIYYYLRIIKIMYFDSSSKQRVTVSSNTTLSVLIGISAIINMTFFLYSGHYLSFLERITQYL